MVLSSRVLEGEYPDYKKIIPGESGINISVDKKELHQAIKLASVFARDSANVVKMSVRKDELEISSESQYSGSQTTKVEAKIQGDKLSSKSDFVIAFNYRFIDDFLSIIQGDDIELSFNEPNTPGVFKDLSDKKYLHLIMPVKLQS
jgi:DNA polymerase-3 subunit beta